MAALSGLLLMGVVTVGVSAQPTSAPQTNQTPDQSVPQQPNSASGLPAEAYVGGVSAALMLGVPITALLPGNVAPGPRPANPVEGQSQAIQRGMTYFTSFNCVGCHAPNGGGGMGPALSNSFFIYGGEPANIYLSIHQGRPNGMPAWGGMLPDSIIWEIVAYIRSISKEPSKTWGKTLSRDAMSEEQVPTEYVESSKPWDATQKFSAGQKPNREK